MELLVIAGTAVASGIARVVLKHLNYKLRKKKLKSKLYKSLSEEDKGRFDEVVEGLKDLDAQYTKKKLKKYIKNYIKHNRDKINPVKLINYVDDLDIDFEDIFDLTNEPVIDSVALQIDKARELLDDAERRRREVINRKNLLKRKQIEKQMKLGREPGKLG